MTSIDPRLPVSGMKLIEPSTLKMEKDTSGDFEKMKAHWSAQAAKAPAGQPVTISAENETARSAGAKTKVDTQILAQLDSDGAITRFLEYMSKTPEERWQEQWLKSKCLTKEQFDALPPEEQQALVDEMTEELKQKLADKAREETAA